MYLRAVLIVGIATLGTATSMAQCYPVNDPGCISSNEQRRINEEANRYNESIRIEEQMRHMREQQDEQRRKIDEMRRRMNEIQIQLLRNPYGFR